MTDENLAMRLAITKGNCPDCQHRGFVLGPRGGVATNIECANLGCRARFNVVTFAGEVVHGERIGNGKDGIAWPSSPADSRAGHRGTMS